MGEPMTEAEARTDTRCEDFDTEPGVHYHAHTLPRCKAQGSVVFAGRLLCWRHLGKRATVEQLTALLRGAEEAGMVAETWPDEEGARDG